MSTPYFDLTESLLAAVAATPGLAGATLVAEAAPPQSANLPAAALLPRDTLSPAGDDIDRLAKARFELTLWRRDVDRQANLLALTQLADAVTDALLADPSRGGSALVGPNGAATEVGRAGPVRATPPMAGLTLHVACWVLPPDGLAPLPTEQQVQIDGDSLLASGPHRMTVGGWQRRRLDRTFAGLDGVVGIDLGATTRPISLAGRLVAANTAALLGLVAAISALNAGDSLHTLTAGDGRSYGNLRLDQLRWGRVLTAGASEVACIGYEMGWSQLG